MQYHFPHCLIRFHGYLKGTNALGDRVTQKTYKGAACPVIVIIPSWLYFSFPLNHSWEVRGHDRAVDDGEICSRKNKVHQNPDRFFPLDCGCRGRIRAVVTRRWG